MKTPAAIILCAALAFPATTVAQDTGAQPEIVAGAVELGVSGALATVEGITDGSVLVRAGLFAEALRGLVAGELDAAYRHQSSLDQVELEGWLSWQRQWGKTGNYPFAAVGGGLGYENVGSFDVTRYPFGLSLGLRFLLDDRAAIRAEYRLQRVFNDPVADYTESRLLLGISVFFRNT